MEGLKFEYKGKFYEVPRFPREEEAYWMLSGGRCPHHGWCKMACNNTHGIYAGCVYSQLNADVRRAFYLKCFPEERAQKILEEFAAAVPDPKPSKKRPKLTREVFGREDCPTWAKWAAVDGSGKAYWYRYKPRLLEGGNPEWVCSAEEEFGGYVLIGQSFDSSDWKHSLIERPQKELPKLTQEVFNRPDCPDWARYAVLDPLGNCYFSFNRPSRGFEFFWKMNGRFSVLAGEQFDASDWENSVIERPIFSSYKILTETNFVALEHSVNELMKQGWIPRGGAVKDDYSYMQTMVKI